MYIFQNKNMLKPKKGTPKHGDNFFKGLTFFFGVSHSNEPGVEEAVEGEIAQQQQSPPQQVQQVLRGTQHLSHRWDVGDPSALFSDKQHRQHHHYWTLMQMFAFIDGTVLNSQHHCSTRSEEDCRNTYNKGQLKRNLILVLGLIYFCVRI